MTYFDISFTKDTTRDLLIETPSLDRLYLALPLQLWHLSGPHGRLLQDGQFYADKIKDYYGVVKLPPIPGQFWAKFKKYTFKDEKELMSLLKWSSSWPLDDHLSLASMMGSLYLVKHLAGRCADINADNGWALVLAADSGHLEVVKYLVEKGADIYAWNDSALSSAARSGHLEVVKYLVSQSADVHADYDYALREAAQNGHLEVVKYLGGA